MTNYPEQLSLFPTDILSLGQDEQAIRPEDSEEAKWSFLLSAAKRKAVLSGTLSGIEVLDGRTVCVLDFEGLRILIPLAHIFDRPAPTEEASIREETLLLNRMLGATMDFIPQQVSLSEHVCIASRALALKERQKRYYESGRVREGILIACRVLGSYRNRLYVEACGLDCTISAKKVSWQWFEDISSVHASGDLVVAKVLSVGRSDFDGSMQCSLSIKDAQEHPDIPAFTRLQLKNSYFGTVTGVRTGIIFVRLQCGVNAKTALWRTVDVPRRGDTVSFFTTRKDPDKILVGGYITRIIRRRGKCSL